MKIEQETWGGIPLLHVYEESMASDAPIALFLHGFGSAKEHNLHFAYTLVNQGVRVILPDAVEHGERAQGKNEAELANMFWQVVVQNVKDVAILYDELRARQYTGKFGLAGTSMGAITTSGSLRVYPFIEAAGLLMGSMSYTDFAAFHLQQLGAKLNFTDAQKGAMLSGLKPFNLIDEPEVLDRVPTYWWHAKNDAVVPFKMSYPHYAELRAQEQAGKATFVVHDNAGHKVTRLAMQEMCQFIAQHLA